MSNEMNVPGKIGVITNSRLEFKLFVEQQNIEKIRAVCIITPGLTDGLTLERFYLTRNAHTNPNFLRLIDSAKLSVVSYELQQHRANSKTTI